MHRYTAKALLVLATLVGLPASALAADQVGAAGYVLELQVNHTTADAFLQYHGRVVVGGKKSSAEYRWGGTSCGSKVLTEHQVMVLTQALTNAVAIEPRYKDGQGSAECLVGFTLLP